MSNNTFYPVFTSPYKNENNELENAQYYGIAHGFAGLLTILSKIKKMEIKEKECDYLIGGIFDHLMSVKDMTNFPLFSTEKVTYWDESFSWCHGNFGIGYSLYLSLIHI